MNIHSSWLCIFDDYWYFGLFNQKFWEIYLLKFSAFFLMECTQECVCVCYGKMMWDFLLMLFGAKYNLWLKYYVFLWNICQGSRNFHIELLLVVSLHNQDKIYDNNILRLTTVYLEQMVFVSDVFCQSLLLNFEIFVYIQSKLEFFLKLS